MCSWPMTGPWCHSHGFQNWPDRIRICLSYFGRWPARPASARKLSAADRVKRWRTNTVSGIGHLRPRPGARPSGWMASIVPILAQFAASTPGSRIEVKTASIAWHYRAVEPEFGTRQAHELRMLLGIVLSNQPLEVLDGNKVIEVGPRGISKALAAQTLEPMGV